MKKITFKFNNLEVQAELNSSQTASWIFEALPVSSTVSRWGDEIYFEIPPKLKPENATLELSIGDIAYWPEGASLCLFFGKTPASVGDRPRPASEVNVVGKFTASRDALRGVRANTGVIVSRSS